MASEIRVDKINSLSGVGTVTLSPTGVDIAGITTAATLRATTGIVTTLTATTGIVTTFEATTGNITTLRTPTGISTHFTADKISLPDTSNGSLNIGVGSDFKFNHDGTHSYITEVGGGDLYIQGSDIILRDAGTLEKHIEMTQNGAVDLYNNNTKRLSTTGNGVDVFGNGTSNNYLKLVNTSGTSNASHHMTLDTYGPGSGGSYWSDLKIDASNIQLNTYTGNRATLSNNALTFASGVNIVMASGNGIDFSATANGNSPSSEILDDYEEGTWTFAITPGGGSYQYNYGQTGYYSKIGNQVFINAWIHLLVASTVSGSITLSGLPFPCQNRSRNWIPVGGYGQSSVSAASGLWLIPTVNGSSGEFIYNNSTFSGATTLTAGNLGNSAEMYINGSYITDS